MNTWHKATGISFAVQGHGPRKDGELTGWVSSESWEMFMVIWWSFHTKITKGFSLPPLFGIFAPQSWAGPMRERAWPQASRRRCQSQPESQFARADICGELWVFISTKKLDPCGEQWMAEQTRQFNMVPIAWLLEFPYSYIARRTDVGKNSEKRTVARFTAHVASPPKKITDRGNFLPCLWKR